MVLFNIWHLKFLTIIPFILPSLICISTFFLLPCETLAPLASIRYALAIVMWELASRRRAYESATRTIIASVIPLGDREDLIPDCPPGYMELVQLCWHNDPNMRPTIDQVLGEITQIKASIQEFWLDPSASSSATLTPASPSSAVTTVTLKSSIPLRSRVQHVHEIVQHIRNSQLLCTDMPYKGVYDAAKGLAEAVPVISQHIQLDNLWRMLASLLII